MKKIAVIAAMKEEAELLKKVASENIIVSTSGIGKVASAVKTAEIIHRFHPDLIINSGIAGGLDSSLEIGDPVIGSSTAYHDVWCGEPNMHGQIQGFPLYFSADSETLNQVHEIARCGLIVSGDQFITNPKQLQKIKEKFPTALAVDMESAAIAQACYIHHTPFISVRLISDTPGVEHHQQQYEQFWKNASANSFKTICALIEKIK